VTTLIIVNIMFCHPDSFAGFAKAEYAVGYFKEVGIGCKQDSLEANMWYWRAAQQGDERAKQRMAAIQKAVSGSSTASAADVHKQKKGFFGKLGL
jgi:TPR repeat protein